MPHRPFAQRGWPTGSLCRRIWLRIPCRVGRQLGLRFVDKRSSLALLPALIAGVVVAAQPAFAQSGWPGSTPVFDSDAKRTSEQAEAERAARRASYGPVAYPKHMDGGERPDIKPAEPPIVYFDQDENVGSIIIDTQGRKLYYVLPGKTGLPVSDLRRPRRLHVVRHRAHQPHCRLAIVDAAPRDAQATAWSANHGVGRAQESAGRTRALSRQHHLSHPRHQQRPQRGTGKLVRLLPHDERARRAPCFNRESRRKGEGAAGLRGRRQRDRAAVVLVQLLGRRAGQAGSSPQGSEAGGEEGEISGCKTAPRPAKASPPPTEAKAAPSAEASKGAQ